MAEYELSPIRARIYRDSRVALTAVNHFDLSRPRQPVSKNRPAIGTGPNEDTPRPETDRRKTAVCQFPGGSRWWRLSPRDSPLPISFSGRVFARPLDALDAAQPFHSDAVCWTVFAGRTARCRLSLRAGSTPVARVARSERSDGRGFSRRPMVTLVP